MNLYSNKQKWKIVLLIFALVLVGASLFVSNNIVLKVGEQERERAKHWADAIKKRIELVQLTNQTFSKLRDKELEKMTLWIDATKELSKDTPLNQDFEKDFPKSIVERNQDIPVILLDDEQNVSGSINLGFNEDSLQKQFPELGIEEITAFFEDSLLRLTEIWGKQNSTFTVEVFPGFFMSYFYSDSREIVKLEAERDSLISAFNDDLINNESLVPVLLVDDKTNEIIGTNIDEYTISEHNVEEHIKLLKAQNTPITIDFNNGTTNTLYFDNSAELKQLQYFPYIQFLVIGLFGMIGYLIFSTFRKAEQNQVWAGMAKETAHQLGTPLSSLIGWVQLLESQGIDPDITAEMQKDVDRLETVTDRFSKIGSDATLEDKDLSATVETIVAYLRPRISDKVQVSITTSEIVETRHNASLMGWVVENICKNAVDAMEGEGQLNISVHGNAEWVYIDIKDSGKGIPSGQLKAIFEPGYSTKKRGWGLGLSLVKRIIKEYHKGTVTVLESRIDEGSTFRISLPSNVL